MNKSRLHIWAGFFLFIITGCTEKQAVQIEHGLDKDGTKSFIIRNQNSTFYYQKAAGGFSSITDNQNRDWVAYSTSDSVQVPQSSDSDFRGLPNLVFRSDDGGAGHPGFDKVTSEQISDFQITSTSKSGKWSWTWTFFDDHALLEVTQIDPDQPYWFLYEGPPAGKYDPEDSFWGTDVLGYQDSTPTLFGETQFFNAQTAYFGQKGDETVLFVHQVSKDNLVDCFAYMGNSKKGIEAEDGMVVFGFGRDKGATPLLRQKEKFIIGFLEIDVSEKKARHGAIMKKINAITLKRKNG